MKCQSCAEKIKSVLDIVPGVTAVKVSGENVSVLVESNLASSIIQQKIESTWNIAVLKGYGGKLGMWFDGSCAIKCSFLLLIN